LLELQQYLQLFVVTIHGFSAVIFMYGQCVLKIKLKHHGQNSVFLTISTAYIIVDQLLNINKCQYRFRLKLEFSLVSSHLTGIFSIGDWYIPNIVSLRYRVLISKQCIQSLKLIWGPSSGITHLCVDIGWHALIPEVKCLNPQSSSSIISQLLL